MLYRTILAAAAAAVLCLGGSVRAEAAPVTFQPEVLLMKSAKNETEKSFDYVKMKPVTMEAPNGSGVFRYRATTDTVTCTIQPGQPGAGGAIVTKVIVQRSSTDPQGHENLATTTGTYTFTPGKSLIVDTTPHIPPVGSAHSVEILQLTLAKG